MTEGIIISVMVILFLLVLGIYKNLLKPFSAFIFSSVSGAASLIIINLLGVQLAVNLYTLSFSLIMGIPGVITMLVLKLLV